MSGLTIGSLFSGIGGLELGLERGIGEGCYTVWQVEQDEYCRAVLAKHWPDAQRFNDVKEVGADNLPPVDIICGGFPCQDISYAGKGAGLEGARSGLWHEYARIICELRPSYVVVENVAALLTRGLDDVLGTLASLGYDAEWDCLSAASVGAPHIRDRLFVLAYTAGDLRGTPRDARSQAPDRRSALLANADSDTERPQQIPQPQRSYSPLAGNDGTQERMAYADGLNARGIISGGNDQGNGRVPRERSAGLRNRTGGNGQWEAEPNVGRVAHGVPSRIHRLKALGNAVVPQVAEVVGRLIAERESELRGVA